MRIVRLLFLPMLRRRGLISDGLRGIQEVLKFKVSYSRVKVIDYEAGVMTVKILALREHMQHNLQDKRSKRALNQLVHARQKMLKYLRRKSPERYIHCLKEIGLDDSAVVREVTGIELKRPISES